LSTLASVEGLISIVGRVAGGLIYDIPIYYSDFTEAEYDFTKGYTLGKVFQLLFNYSIA
jgi:hypothetical protein